MITRKQVISLMPKILGQTKIVNEFGITKDIISVVKEHYESNYLQSKEIAKYFKGKNITETCKNIWEWTRKNIKYKIDEGGKQNIKSPSSVVNSGFADCKGLSIFILSVLQNLGIKANFRYACYRGKEVTHVYVVAYDEQGRTISVDACIGCFNVEKPNIFHKDIMTQISKISGIGNAVCGCGCGKKNHRKYKKIAVAGVDDENFIASLYDNEISDVFVGDVRVYEDSNVGTTQERYTMPFYLQDDTIAVHGTFIGSIHEIGFLRKTFKKIGQGVKNAGQFIKKNAGAGLTMGLNFVPGGGVINQIRENVRTGKKFYKGLAKAGVMDAVTSFVPGGKVAKAGLMIAKGAKILKGVKAGTKVLKGAQKLSLLAKAKNLVQKGKRVFETIKQVREQFAPQEQAEFSQQEAQLETYQPQQYEQPEEEIFRQNVRESVQDVREQAEESGLDPDQMQAQWQQNYSDNLQNQQEQEEEPQF